MAGKLAINGGVPVRNKPFPSWPVYGEADEQAVFEAVHSGRWGRYGGEQVATFEAEFAAYQGARYGIAVMNGTVALRLSLMAANLQAGDEIIVPPYTFAATATAVVEVNCVPIFVDIEPDTYCLDPDSLEAALTPQTRAVIPVHFAGQAANMDRIMAIADQHNLVVIEDAAHAHGAAYKDRGLGTIGHTGCFSFQATKNLTAGEGGIILTNDDHYERLCRSFHTCGRYPEGAWYEHFLIGGNYRMTELQGALLLAQLARLEEQTRTRDKNGRYLNQKLADIPGIRPLTRGHGETRHAYHLYIFRYDSEAFGGVSRDRFLEALAAEGIPCSEGYPFPLYRQALFTDRAFGPFTGYRRTRPDIDYANVSCPVTERACYGEACWLTQPMMLGSQADMDDIVRAVSKVWENREELLS